MKKFIKLMIIANFVNFLASCSVTDSLIKKEEALIIPTITAINKVAIETICSQPEDTRVVALVNMVNSEIKPNTLSISCPQQVISTVNLPTLKPFSKLQLTAIKGSVLTYCTDPLLAGGILTEVNTVLSPISVSITCN